MSVRDIQGHLRDLYGIEVSPQLISTVTDAVLEEVGRWQSRPLDPLYALVFFDALRVKMRDEGAVRNKAVYLALGVTPEGRKDVLGIWIEQTEGAKFWLRVMTELKNRGVNDILIAIVDGLKGFPEAINAVFAETQIQTCIVHLIRNSLDFCSWKDRISPHALLQKETIEEAISPSRFGRYEHETRAKLSVTLDSTRRYLELPCDQVLSMLYIRVVDANYQGLSGLGRLGALYVRNSKSLGLKFPPNSHCVTANCHVARTHIAETADLKDPGCRAIRHASAKLGK
jgi:hypothetical protein